MRIFLTLHFSSNLSVPGSLTWYRNLYEPLADLGHDVYLLSLGEFSLRSNVPFRGKKFRESFSNELLAAFRENHKKKPFDLFLSYLTSSDINPECLSLIRQEGVPMLNFSCNNTHQFDLVSGISKFFDFNLHSEKDAAPKFRDVGATPVWFPMAANPEYYFPSGNEKIFDATFIGAAYAKRSYYIHHLVNNHVKVDCFGPNWLVNRPYNGLKKLKKETERTVMLLGSILTFSPYRRILMSSAINDYDLLLLTRELNKGRMHYPCSDVERIKIVNQSKINLGFLEVFANEGGVPVVKQHIHLREFEIPMCAGLYFTNHSDELAEFFEPGREIVTFGSEHELLDKINYYLKNEISAEEIRKAALQRALSCHTYQKRFKDLFATLNLRS